MGRTRSRADRRSQIASEDRPVVAPANEMGKTVCTIPSLIRLPCLQINHQLLLSIATTILVHGFD
jgi:hypothetical protein